MNTTSVHFNMYLPHIWNLPSNFFATSSLNFSLILLETSSTVHSVNCLEAPSIVLTSIWKGRKKTTKEKLACAKGIDGYCAQIWTNSTLAPVLFLVKQGALTGCAMRCFFTEFFTVFLFLCAMKRSWSQSEIVWCQCSELSYAHVHCPCISCNGKAVSSLVEFRHWQWQNSLEVADPVLDHDW